MPLYRWSDGAIAQMECVSSEPGKMQAILRPHEGADRNKLNELHQALSEKGIASFARCEKTCDALIVPEVKDAHALLNVLGEGKWTNGAPQIIVTAADKQNGKEGFLDKVKRKSLFLAAMFYNLGNISYIVSGIVRGKHNRDGKFTSADLSEMMVGVTFGMGDVLFTLYSPDESKNPLISFSKGLDDYLKQHGVVVPTGKDATPETIHKSGFFEAANDFISHNITSIKCVAEVVGGGFTVKSGLKPGNVNAGKVAAGIMISTGWLTTLLLDKPHAPPFEFKPEEDLNTRSTGKKMAGWLASHPRAPASYLAMGNNIANLSGTLWPKKGEAWRYRREVTAARAAVAAGGGAAAQGDLHYAERKQYDFAWNIITACSFLVGNRLFGMSGDKNKANRAHEGEEFTQDLLTVAANVLSNVPEKARNYAVEEAAEYLTSIKGVHLSREDAIKAINEHITQLRQNAFMRAGTETAPAPAR